MLPPLLVVLLLFGLFGTTVELLLLKHYESAWMFAPFVTIAVAAAGAVVRLAQSIGHHGAMAAPVDAATSRGWCGWGLPPLSRRPRIPDRYGPDAPAMADVLEDRSICRRPRRWRRAC